VQAHPIPALIRPTYRELSTFSSLKLHGNVAWKDAGYITKCFIKSYLIACM